MVDLSWNLCILY